MGECLITRRGGEIYKLPILDSSYPKDATLTVIKGNSTSATFSAIVSEAGNPAKYTYQWYVNGSAVSGATGSSYTKSDLTENGTYSIYCEITNKAGTVTTRVATLKVIQYYTPILDSNYPMDIIGAEIGSSATFYAVATSVGYPDSYTYQWYVNGSAVSGATGSSYTKNNLTNGIYSIYCRITNDAGTVQTRTATLTVTTLYIFKSGTGFTSSINSFSTSDSSSKVTANTIQITATLNALEETISFQSQQTVDVSNFKTMVFTGVTAKWGPSQSAHHVIALNVSGAGSASVTIGQGNVDQYPDLVMCNNATFTIDVSNISGNVYIGGYYSSSRMDVSNTGTIIIQNICLIA